ncbi:MAG: glycosyltransferase family 4 protein [Alphaproteobacteria bacterium]|nr:glycosyltransferase family 4 protein [Alphaproteobacteria bacterium]
MPADGRLRAVVELARFDKGGLEKVVLDSTLALRAAGIESVIVSVGPLGDLAAAAQAAGLRVAALPASGAERAYGRLLDDVQPAVAVSHFSTLGYRLFARRGIPVVSFIHNVYAFLGEAARRRFLADDRVVHRYIAVSPKAAEYAAARFGIDPARVVTIANGLDVAEYERRAAAARPVARASLGIAADDYVFLNVAAYNLHKGHYLMAAAMRRLLARRRDIRIVCVGNEVHPPHVAGLRAWLAEHGLDRHMLLPGYAARVEDLFAMADAFLLPSFIEGWSIAMNEAMVFGKPMVLTDTGGASEVIEDDDTGILVGNEYGPVTALDAPLLDRLAYETRDFRTAELLAAAMERLADAPGEWAAAGARGRAKLVQRYHLHTVAAHYAAALRAAARS